MEPNNIHSDIASLPPEAQQQVFDFIAFLKVRYQRTNASKKTAASKIANEPFIGMWESRRDMKDSSQWVRRSRDAEWGAR
ncbi:MAG: DUF2281 domain-containing protein [Desulfobacterales bacterium]|nr:DUF2281 domain-containing protein [Desulfobacterales bacterium]